METTTRSPAPQPAFHADDSEEVANYHTLSGLAVVALIFGLAAPLCLMFPLLTAIPLVGVAVSLLALRRVAASDGALVGRWAAITGLALCVAAGVAALSRAEVTRYLSTRQAGEFASQWIELLNAGKLEQAFQLTVAGNRMEPPPTPGGPPVTESPFEEFSHHPLVRELSAAGENAEIQLAETMLFDPQPGRQCFVQQRFTVTPAATPVGANSAAEKPIEAILTTQRSRLSREARLRWLIAAYAATPAPGR